MSSATVTRLMLILLPATLAWAQPAHAQCKNGQQRPGQQGGQFPGGQPGQQGAGLQGGLMAQNPQMPPPLQNMQLQQMLLRQQQPGNALLGQQPQLQNPLAGQNGVLNGLPGQNAMFNGLQQPNNFMALQQQQMGLMALLQQQQQQINALTNALQQQNGLQKPTNLMAELQKQKKTNTDLVALPKKLKNANYQSNPIGGFTTISELEEYQEALETAAKKTKDLLANLRDAGAPSNNQWVRTMERQLTQLTDLSKKYASY